jgi:type IV secretory pathway VirJ component
VYGRGEDESLCRTAPPGLMEALGRDGKHHFDGDYEGVARDILARM